jgi:hypothetical protein
VTHCCEVLALHQMSCQTHSRAARLLSLGDVSVPIATDETLALDDLQQPRRPINGRSLAATQQRRSADSDVSSATGLERGHRTNQHDPRLDLLLVDE